MVKLTEEILDGVFVFSDMPFHFSSKTGRKSNYYSKTHLE